MWCSFDLIEWNMQNYGHWQSLTTWSLNPPFCTCHLTPKPAGSFWGCFEKWHAQLIFITKVGVFGVRSSYWSVFDPCWSFAIDKSQLGVFRHFGADTSSPDCHLAVSSTSQGTWHGKVLEIYILRKLHCKFAYSVRIITHKTKINQIRLEMGVWCPQTQGSKIWLFLRRWAHTPIPWWPSKGEVDTSKPKS